MPMSDHLAAVRAKIGHDLIATTAAAVSVFDQRGSLLLVQLADSGHWSLPGGAIDPDEAPADAAVRECWEETGLLVEPIGLIGVFGGPEFRVRYPNGDVTYYTTIAFAARVIGGSLQVDGDETVALRYWTKAECNDTASLTSSGRIIAAQSFEHAERPYFKPVTWSPGNRDQG
jgi:8-oxo-dGTP pyrophosphatase MutT (NUDIX family)